MHVEYNVFGLGLTGVIVPCKTALSRETSVYHAIQRAAQEKGWEYFRVENKLQNGFPDMLVFKSKQYWLIEAKMLHKRTIHRLEDDLEWQPGQLAFMVRALRSGAHYMLAVGDKTNCITYCIGKNHGIENFPDFVGCVGLV